MLHIHWGLKAWGRGEKHLAMSLHSGDKANRTSSPGASCPDRGKEALTNYTLAFKAVPRCDIYSFFSRFIHRRKSHGSMLDIKRMGKCYQSCAHGRASNIWQTALANNEWIGNSLKVFIYPGVCKVQAVYLVWCFSFLADTFSILTWKSWLKYYHLSNAAFH